jgi:hypothetical protein
MAENTKQDFAKRVDVSADAEETPAVKETVAPPEEAPAEDKVVKVEVRLTEDYDGPDPVFVSTTRANGTHDRIEFTQGESVEVPYTDVESFTSLPYIEVAE